MVSKISGPIPGQSLTDTPKNYPWERPPEINDPDSAIVYHLDRLYEQEVAEGVLFLLEFGFPVETLVDSILTASVGMGMHSVDMSLIIAPIIHEEINWMANTANITLRSSLVRTKKRNKRKKKSFKLSESIKHIHQCSLFLKM